MVVPFSSATSLLSYDIDFKMVEYKFNKCTLVTVENLFRKIFKVFIANYIFRIFRNSRIKNKKKITKVQQ